MKPIKIMVDHLNTFQNGADAWPISILFLRSASTIFSFNEFSCSLWSYTVFTPSLRVSTYTSRASGITELSSHHELACKRPSWSRKMTTPDNCCPPLDELADEVLCVNFPPSICGGSRCTSTSWNHVTAGSGFHSWPPCFFIIFVSPYC
jgi:hypothetical protein